MRSPSASGSTTCFTEALNKPSFMSEDELKKVILEVSSFLQHKIYFKRWKQKGSKCY